MRKLVTTVLVFVKITNFTLIGLAPQLRTDWMVKIGFQRNFFTFSSGYGIVFIHPTKGWF